MIRQLDSPQIKKRAEKIAKMIHMDLLRQGKEVYLNTSGSSMYPFIKGYDTMKVVPLKEEDIKIGDIIAIDNEKHGDAWFYVHRVINILEVNRRRIYVTKGDANRVGIDRPVGFREIVGKLAGIEREGLKIDYTNPLWKGYFNKRIAGVSRRYGKRLRAFAPYIGLALERKKLLSKLKKGIRKLDEPLCNAEEFLLLSGRSNLSEESIKKAKDLLRKGIDWEFFMENALRSGMSFLFYNTLNKIDCPALIPKEFIDRLKMAYLWALRKVSPQYREAGSLLRSFFDKNIRALPLKGAFLSKRLYGDIAARGISVDIDLLIEKKDKDPSREVLEEAGYLFMSHSGMGERLGQHVFRKKDETVVDLHWEINPSVPSAERMPGFWKGTRLRKEDDLRYYEFEEEELLLHLSVHLVDSANLVQWRYIADINELLTKYKHSFKWESAIDKARRWRLSNTLYIALMLSRALFGSHVPDEVLAELKPGFPKRFLVKILADRRVILHKNSLRRRFLLKFLCYILYQTLEAVSIKEFLSMVFPPQTTASDKTNFQKFLGGISKLAKSIRH